MTESVLAEALVDNHRHFLSFLERRVGSREEAEDILQEAFVRSLERGDQLRDAESAKAWFYRLLRNAVIDHYRHRGAESRALAAVAAESSEIAPDEEMFDEVCRCIDTLVDTLKPEYAEAIRRVELEEMPVKTYAEQAGITQSNAGVRVFRARQALRKQVLASCGTCAEHGCEACGCNPESCRTSAAIERRTTA
jgi:RNA polymerase sigma-70 factor (ECF subfamily)